MTGSPLFRDDAFRFMTDLALGATHHRAADVGECLATASRIRDGDAESWFSEWDALAGRTAATAERSEAAGHRVSASEAWLRAATYWDTAAFFLDSTADPDRMLPCWTRHREAWEGFARTHEPEVERVSIPHEETQLEGWFFSTPGGTGRRPLLVLNNGSDGPVSAMWVLGAAGALARGYVCLAFDGPGQGAALWRDGIPFRPDWEAVIKPVVDYAVTRPDVDPARIALLGISQAGYWVPRAAAFEHRIAAAVADPGVMDVSTSWLAHLDPSLRALLDEGDREMFDQAIDEGTRGSPRIRGDLAFRMRPFGMTSPFDVFTAVQDYSLADVVYRIQCPILITDPEGEQFWPLQAERLYEAVSTPSERKALVRFTAAEGADSHCEPRAVGLRDQRIFDWLDDTLERV